jgi:hypothetical protein
MWVILDGLMIFELKSLAQIRQDAPGLMKPGSWLVINIEPKMPWPSITQSFEFEDHEVWLIPITEDAYPGLAVRNARLPRDEALAMLYRALSMISWLEDGGAVVVSRGGGSPLFPIYGSKNQRLTIRSDPFDDSQFIIINSDDAKLALALMREGRGLRHPAYSFLTFYRVLELALPHGSKRGNWMSEAVERIQDSRAQEALQELRKDYQGDVGVHLRDSGRSAIVHATKRPIANPDNPADYIRLDRELPIIESLAVMAIEEIIGVQTSSKIWKEHLYELKGWKEVFGEQLIDIIKSGGTPKPDDTLELPEIHLRLRRTGTYDPLENLIPKGWGVHETKGFVEYKSRNGLVSLTLLLDFNGERIIVEPGRGIGFFDDGTIEAANTGKYLAKFFQDWNANGELQVWDAETGNILSRCDPFIPVNVIFNPDGAKAELEIWDKEIVRRSKTNLNFGF